MASGSEGSDSALEVAYAEVVLAAAVGGQGYHRKVAVAEEEGPGGTAVGAVGTAVDAEDGGNVVAEAGVARYPRACKRREGTRCLVDGFAEGILEGDRRLGWRKRRSRALGGCRRLIADDARMSWMMEALESPMGFAHEYLWMDTASAVMEVAMAAVCRTRTEEGRSVKGFAAEAFESLLGQHRFHQSANQASAGNLPCGLGV